MQDNQSAEITNKLTLKFDGKVCIKCQYKRQPTDNAPEWACPSCGVAYVKAEAAAREEQAQLSLQNRIERVEFIKANEKVNPRQAAKIKSDKSIANLIYILFFGAILGGVTALAAIAMAHAHRNSIGQQNWVQSHYAWQIRTFWLGSLWSALGLFLVVISFITASTKGLQNRSLNDALITFFNPFMLMGLAIIVISTLWFWYRMIKGCVVLNRDETVGDFFDASM
ncbi:MAG: hypothetical protein Q8S55_06040 [Methylococcaceae bacterium]|nr:hypothetical protein [Methylococcaceae bacterium]